MVPLQLNADVSGGGTVNVTITSVPSGHFLPLEEARAIMGYKSSGEALTLTPGIRIGEPPGAPALTVIENNTDDDAPRTADDAPDFEFK